MLSVELITAAVEHFVNEIYEKIMKIQNRIFNEVIKPMTRTLRVHIDPTSLSDGKISMTRTPRVYIDPTSLTDGMISVYGSAVIGKLAEPVKLCHDRKCVEISIPKNSYLVGSNLFYNCQNLDKEKYFCQTLKNFETLQYNSEALYFRAAIDETLFKYNIGEGTFTWPNQTENPFYLSDDEIEDLVAETLGLPSKFGQMIRSDLSMGYITIFHVLLMPILIIKGIIRLVRWIIKRKSITEASEKRKIYAHLNSILSDHLSANRERGYKTEASKSRRNKRRRNQESRFMEIE